jgi:hypothetical protein
MYSPRRVLISLPLVLLPLSDLDEPTRRSPEVVEAEVLLEHPEVEVQ